MKRLSLFLVFLSLVLAVVAQNGTDYGKPVVTKKALDVPKLKKELDKKPKWSGVITGKVKEVCKREGCWLRLDDGSEKGLMVKMKDHDFTVPKDIDGKTVYIYGTATKTNTSVKMLQHYAEDAGKSKEEIAAITKPETAISIEAEGVKVLD